MLPKIAIRLAIILVALTLWACSVQDFETAGHIASYCAKNPGHC